VEEREEVMVQGLICRREIYCVGAVSSATVIGSACRLHMSGVNAV
jgi:hypothetical protein